MTVDELADLILKNKEIYKLNNGGVTLTGGEPLFQADFVLKLLRRIKPDIHTAIETSGYAPASVFKEILPLLDLVLFDIKHMDPVQHKKYTGVDNRLIQENLKTLCLSGNKFIIRVPLIPGVNDTEENMEAILGVIKGVDSLVRIELLRYNKIAGAKYPMIGKVYEPPFDPEISPRIYNIFEENNIKTLVL